MNKINTYEILIQKIIVLGYSDEQAVKMILSAYDIKDEDNSLLDEIKKNIIDDINEAKGKSK